MNSSTEDNPLPSDYSAVRNAVLEWYTAHARQFLWRSANPNPYVALVAEIMLQQTQTARVAEKLPPFLEQFPNFSALAAASNAAIIRSWQGMGYNNRALRLRDCARAVVERHSGQLPDSPDDLAALPGIGPYTRAALLAFVFHRDVAVIDVNIRRVYSRVFGKMTLSTDVLPEPELTSISQVIFPHGKSSAWHQAIMDIGALFCTARRPNCTACPLSVVCRSAFSIQTVVKIKRAEPARFDIPNRIWRGKTVEVLRNVPHGVALAEGELFTRAIERPATDADTEWFRGLLAALERDGVVVLVSGMNDEYTVALRE